MEKFKIISKEYGRRGNLAVCILDSPCVCTRPSCRKPETLQAVEQTIKVEAPDVNTKLLTLDLSSQESVRKAADGINSLPESIDILITHG